MIVDPATGLPVDAGVPTANSLGGQVGMDVANSYGYSQDRIPLFYDIMSNIPGAATVSGWNVGRVSNTIVQGGRRTGVNAGRGGIIRQGVPQTFNPAAFRRLARPANIDPTWRNMGLTGGRPFYSPFNFLSTIGNKAMGSSRLAATSAAQRLSGATVMGSSEPYFSPGTIGRISALNRIGGMSDSAFTAARGNILGAIGDIRPDFAAGQNIAGRMGNISTTAGQRAFARGALAGTMDTRISGRVAGYMLGAQEMRRAAGGAGDLMNVMRGARGTQYVQSGIMEGARAYQAGSTTARVAGSRSFAMASRAIGPVSNAILVYDLAKMAGKVAGRAAEATMNSMQSMKGSIDKPTMGMGFKDNSVAATSRQRGVMAISNSRLNARSVLGNEAAALHAYYG